jgi:hypothetical protein
MEKKIEVEVNGKKVRIMEHTLMDASMFGATIIKRQVKEPPKELGLIKKTILPPRLETPEEVIVVEPPPEVPVKKPIGRKKR